MRSTTCAEFNNIFHLPTNLPTNPCENLSVSSNTVGIKSIHSVTNHD